jgi:DNA recombination protein RmuC
MNALIDRWTALRLEAEIQVDEAIADAQAQLAGLGEGATAGASGGVFGLPLWVVILILLTIIAVGAMLLIVAGSLKRQREAADAYDGPLFADQYALDEDETEAEDDGFASIRIEEAPVRRDARFDAAPLDEEEVQEAEEPENVVRLRAVGSDYEPAPQPARGPVAEEPRYPFGGPSMPRFTGQNESPADQPMRRGATTEVNEGWRREPHRGGDDERGRASSDDAPFVAPYIRDDIERSERRQAERMSEFRDEVSRQFASMKNENASRLDLFVSTVERKLDSVGGDRGDVSPLALRRAAEEAVRPLTDRISERLADLAGRVATQDERLADMATLLERRLDALPGLGEGLKRAEGDLSSLGEEVRGTRSELTGSFHGLQETMERIERAILERAREEGSASVALTEVVRGTLPEGTYAFGRTLANGEKADCVIAFDGLRERIAIDAGFPMKAFDELPSRDAVRKNLPQAKASEDQFRRAVLRAILEAADRCIVPGETADSCLLFLPSEAAYTILHDRFGDLVRDAQRARVWLTSPSTLMGTLALLKNLMPTSGPAPSERAVTEKAEDDALARERRKAEAAKDQPRLAAEAREQQALRDEVRALRERASGLAAELDRTRGTLAELIETTDKLSAEDDEADEAYSFAGADWAEDDREHRFED